jgi:hypothetical protein
MSVVLKDGSAVDDPRFDRLYQLDWRSLDYSVSKRVSAREMQVPRSYSWDCPLVLDQGSQGSCVGFGFTHDLAAKPVAVGGVSDDLARQIYWASQRADDWPGGSYENATPFYEGTSVLAGAKILTTMGYYLSYHWALDIRELAVGIGYTGPAILGFNWYEGMREADTDDFLHVSGKQSGGHCILANKVKIKKKVLLVSRTWDNVDMDRSYLVLHNSWSRSWGRDGEAKLSLADADRLLNEQGDACFPERNPKKRMVQP